MSTIREMAKEMTDAQLREARSIFDAELAERQATRKRKATGKRRRVLRVSYRPTPPQPKSEYEVWQRAKKHLGVPLY